MRLDFVFAGANGSAKLLSAGELERFTDLPGKSTALDRDLRDSLLDYPAADVSRALDVAGLQLYAKVSELEGGTATLADYATLTDQTLKPALQKGYAVSQNPRSHEVSGPSCLGCHVASAARATFGLTPVQNAVIRDDTLGITAYDLDAVGPGTKLEQVTFNKTWNLRGFGYFGQLPVVSDRVVAEVDEDVRVINQWRAIWK